MSDATLSPDAAAPEPTVPPRSRWKSAAKIGAALVVVAGLLFAGKHLGGYLEGFRAWIEGLGPWAPVVFMLGYALATVALVPGSLLTAGSGVLFGLFWGTVYAWTGATVGAGAAFLIARYGARGWVERKLEGNTTFLHVDASIGKDGGKIVALLRLVPVFPFVLLNYALGLTRVRFWHYMVASLAMLPGTLLYVYYGYIGRSIADGGRTVWDWILLGVGVVAVLAVTVLITKKAKRALAERTELEASDVGGE